jgi:hypothetical protein
MVDYKEATIVLFGFSITMFVLSYGFWTPVVFPTIDFSERYPFRLDATAPHEEPRGDVGDAPSGNVADDALSSDKRDYRPPPSKTLNRKISSSVDSKMKGECPPCACAPADPISNPRLYRQHHSPWEPFPEDFCGCENEGFLIAFIFFIVLTFVITVLILCYRR